MLCPVSDDEFLLTAALIVLGWVVVSLLGAIERRVRPALEPQGEPPRWAALAVVGLGLLAAAVRAPFAVGRELRNVDESQYAALAAFLAATGESMFSMFSRASWAPHRLGTLDAPFAAPDVAASLAVGATGALLGLLVLRASKAPLAALLAPPCYALGLLKFEGLTSNSEVWVNLALAAWACARLAAPLDGDDRRAALRRAAAGACLGVAGLMKEQALPLLALVPLLEALDARRVGARRAALRAAQGLAGAALPVALWALGLLLHGSLTFYLRHLLLTGADAGEPVQGAGDDSLLLAPLLLLGGLAQLWQGPVGLLGLTAVGRHLFDGARAEEPARRAEVGLTLLALATMACVSIGLRFFQHYYMLALVALAPLAALQLSRLLGDLRRGPRGPRAFALVTLALTALLAAGEARLLSAVPGFAAGHGLDAAEERARLERAGRRVAELVPPGRPILVWGWRPELYQAAGRAPSSRYLAGEPLVKLYEERLFADLERWPPAAVVIAVDQGPTANVEGGDPFALARHPRLVAWLAARGFEPREEVAGYRLLLPRRPG
jgi:hypothetical protein